MIVTDVGHGMRWTRQRRARDVMAGRVSLETCERSNGAQTNDANADGKTVCVKLAEVRRPNRAQTALIR
jgi:hypothetical protein